jgi:adenylate cyclase
VPAGRRLTRGFGRDSKDCPSPIRLGRTSISEAQRDQIGLFCRLGNSPLVEGDDRYGEGVNVAERLQQLADRGGLCVSGKVAKEVERKLAYRFEPMGEQHVKNIAEPVAVYRVLADRTPTRRPLLRRSPLTSRARTAMERLACC